MKNSTADRKKNGIIPTMGINNCGARCIIRAHVRNGQIEKLSTQTHAEAGDQVPLCACMRGLSAHQTFLSRDRLQFPMKRTGARGEGRFTRISWDEATDIIAREWIRIRDTYGPGSRYVGYATGIEGVMRGDAMARRLLNLDGGSLEYYNNYSTGCIAPATRLMYGTLNTGNDPGEWLKAKLIILMGHNPAETRFDCTMHYLRQARDLGIPIIVIDPRKNDTVQELGAQWIPIRPATDSALLDGMAGVILEEGLQDQAFLDRCCLGFDEAHMPEGIAPNESYRAYLTGKKDGVRKTAAWASQITGVPEAQIRELAIRYASASPAALIQGYGAQRHSSGEQSVRGGIALACMTGNVGIAGGWACGLANIPGHRVPEFPEGDNPYKVRIPVYAWTKAVADGTGMTPQDGLRDGDHLESNIRMIVSLASNVLINQHGDINRTAALLRDPSRCEFIVCSDLFMTASARYADILLPGASVFEMDNITFPWKYGDFLGYCNQIIDPVGEARPEYDWLSEVAYKLGYGDAFTQGRTGAEWLEAIYEDLRQTEQELPSYRTFQQEGIYRYQENSSRIAFEQEVKDPVRHPFPTASGRIEIFSSRLYQDQQQGRGPDTIPPIPGYTAPEEGPQDPLTARYPLQLIGWHTRRRCHSIHDNNEQLRAQDPQQLWMHPADAAARQITDGEEVLVWNDRGKMQIPVKVTDRIMRGVTALAQGAWYQPDENGTDHGGCINVLTSQKITGYAKGNPQHSNLVEVGKIQRPV